MSKLTVFLASVGLMVLPCALAQGDRIPFSITISAANNVLRAGGDVKIRLILRNTSNDEIPYTRGPGVGVEPHGEIFTEVQVRKAKGELAPETRYNRLLHGKLGANSKPSAGQGPGGASETPMGVFGSFVGSMLKPGDFREEDIDVSKLYDLSQPGQYTITASRRLIDLASDPRSKIIAKSNALTITIVR